MTADRNIYLDAALSWLEMGFSPLPPREDGSKAPLADIDTGDPDKPLTWAPYQTTPASRGQVEAWYRQGRTGVGVCGGVGGLEPFEFDDRDTYERFKEAAAAVGLGDLVDRIEAGYCEESPSGGIHWMYICEEIRGPAKLAERPIPGSKHGRKTLIETKGLGGFIITAPSCGKVHPTGKPYRLLSGRQDLIETISPEERQALWDLAATHDEIPAPTIAPPRPKSANGQVRDGLKPGEAYGAETTWEDILEPLGWVKVYTRGDTTYWRRPGKDAGVSATTGRCKGLYVFTTSTQFTPRRSYTKFAAYALIAHGIDHDGDYSVAAQALARMGLGQQPAKGRPEGNGAYRLPDRTTLPDRLIILASEVEPRKVEWLWPQRIPLGKLTTFAGWGGLGKSFVTMDLAARISIGGEIPGMAGECFSASSVLILNTEDDPDDTSVPRLIEAGADLGRIGFARSEVLSQFTLADLKVLDAMLTQLGDVRLLIIDPATAHLGGINDHKNADLRALLMPLSLWAMERHLAVILVTHVNKAQADKVNAMARVVGSVAWVNAVRAAVMFAKDPENPGQRLFVPFKSNNAPEQKGLGYRIAPTESLARVEWLGEVDTSADDAMNPQGRKPRRLEASMWLIERFRENLRWHSADLFQAAKEAGISRSAIFEAKKTLCLPPASQEYDLDGNRSWVWWVPTGWQGFEQKP